MTLIDAIKRNPMIIVLIVIVLGIVGVIATPKISHYIEVKNTYIDAEKLIEKENYIGALELLEKIEWEEYKDTEDYISLCEAYKYYEEGDVNWAHWSLKKSSYEYLDKVQQNKVEEFAEQLEEEYDKYLEKEAEAREREYRIKIRSGVPFVGMSEDDINHTSLGWAENTVRHNKEMISGKSYTANIYDYKRGTNIIFTARCVQGRVTDVWDYRDNPKKPYNSNSSSSSGSKKSNEDWYEYYESYGVYDYNNPEDYYYDYYDDFWEYEEAEDFWNEAQEYVQ